MIAAPEQTERDRFERKCPLPLPDALRASRFSGCLNVIAPMIENARGLVRRGARRLAAEYPAAPFDLKTIEECLAANLVGPLLGMLTPTAVLELNITRLEGSLSGETSQDRFQSFVDSLADAEVATRLLDEYSVLREQVAGRLEKWRHFSLELLHNICEDWPSIRESLLMNDPGAIIRIDSGAGDTHRNGRSVAIVSFASGDRIVYKPRSLAVDEHFQQLLEWLNSRGAQPPFRTLKSLDRGDHGWAEFVTKGECASADEVCRFYKRQGSYLAILYALEASDFHCENLIAAGEHPVLIDLEALFHPRVDKHSPEDAGLAGAALGYSAMRVGLLPLRFQSGDEEIGIDLSGLGSSEGQLTPFVVPIWEEVETDEMHSVRKRVPIGASDNRPSLNGTDANPLDYTEEIAAGFESAYRLLLANRSEFSAVLSRFASDEVRVIARATQTYATLLRESFHPDVLRNGADRLALFDRLQEAVEYRPRLEPLVPGEREDLLRGDVPLFTTRPGSRDLWTGSHDRIENYFDEPGIALVHRRLEQLSETDLERQLWIVRASLATLSSRAEGPPVRNDASHRTGQTEVSRSELIRAACHIGDRLSELALRSGDDVGWLGLVPTTERDWVLSPLGFDLYDGLPGVALFLAQLGLVSDEPKYTELARSAIATVRRHLAQLRSQEVIGGFTGTGGLIYALSSLGILWNEATLIDEAESLLESLPALISRDKALDVIGGSAGCALALQTLRAVRPSAKVVEIARACGEQLLRTAQPVEQRLGLGWLCNSRTSTPLTGYAHGSAGIGHALLTIAELTGDARFQESALEAFRYERALFSEQHRNWPDLRTNDVFYITAWCHGAPGIGLSRLFASRLFTDPELHTEIDNALATTSSAGFTGNHTLCHGDLGNADILLTASEVLGDGRWREHANRIAACAIAASQSSGWICGNPLGVESPGLMTGIAGIGYALLRHADSKRVPSVLALEPPLPL